MKILYFHQYFTTPDVAGGTRSYEMAQKLIARGHQVTMVCVKANNQDLGLKPDKNGVIYKGVVHGINVIQFNLTYNNYFSLPRRAALFLSYALKSIAIVLKSDYDLVLATSTPLTAGIPGIIARIFHRKPFVFEVRDLWPELPKAMDIVTNPLVLFAMSALEWTTYRFASSCIALSPGIKKGITKRSPENRRITMIPNGCDTQLFIPGDRKNLDLPDILSSQFVAVFTGAHGMANGLDAVLDAAKVLKERNREDIVLAFIGDGKLKPALINRAKNENLDNCRFFDPMPKKKLNTIVSSVNLGLMILDNVPAFYYGTSPNKFFDYISSGLPVLNNYPGWLADLVTEHQCGIAVLPSDANAFADALCFLADNPEKCHEYGKNARKLALELFSRDKLSDQFAEWLEAEIREK